MSSMTKQSSFEWIVYICILTYNSQEIFGSINTFILKKNKIVITRQQKKQITFLIGTVIYF